MGNNKSTFVTVVSWVFIVLSGLATLISVMQNIMIHVMFKKDEFSNIPNDAPAGSALIFGNFEIIFFMFFLVCLATLISSIGLLKRKNWARITFILFLVIGIVLVIANIIFQNIFFLDIPQSSVDDDFKKMQSIMQTFTIIFGISISVLFGWIIKILTSVPVKKEFMTSMDNTNVEST